MAITFAPGGVGTAKERIGAVNEVLYQPTVQALTGTSTYWGEIVRRLSDPPAPMYASFYTVGSVEEDTRPVRVVSFVDAPPDDTDW